MGNSIAFFDSCFLLSKKATNSKNSRSTAYWLIKIKDVDENYLENVEIRLCVLLEGDTYNIITAW